MKLSILIAGLIQRSAKSSDLKMELGRQISKHPWDVEILVLEDMMLKPTGVKRNALLDMASGDFTAFVDDDDMVSPDYIEKILAAIKSYPDADCITFSIEYSVDGAYQFTAKYDHLQPWPHDGGSPVRTYSGSHTMVWNRKVTKDLRFDEKWWEEDLPFTRAAISRIDKQVVIPDVLYYYRCVSGFKEHLFMERVNSARMA